MRLLIASGQSIDAIPLGAEPVKIGRSPKNDVVIEDPQLSRFHAVIEREGEEQVFRDLESSNGSRINGLKVNMARLRVGDTIVLGSAVLLVASEESGTEQLAAGTVRLEDFDALRDLDARRAVQDTILKLFLSQQQGGAIDAQSLLEAILDGAIAATGYERGLILLPQTRGFRVLLGRNADGQVLNTEASRFSRTVIRDALNRRGAVTIVGTGGDGYAGEASLEQTRAAATLCLPLLPPRRLSLSDSKAMLPYDGDLIPGFLYLDSLAPKPQLDRELLTLLQALAVHAAITLENARLFRDASRDALTGLLNRQAFEGHLRARLESGEPGALVMIDVDHFKAINDEHGHPEGDAVLRGVATVLSETIDAHGFVGRYGGEEFIAFLDGVQGILLAEGLRQAIGATPYTEAELTVTASFGVAQFPKHGKSPAELIARADVALYQAKNGGRNQVQVWRGAPTDGEVARKPASAADCFAAALAMSAASTRGTDDEAILTIARAAHEVAPVRSATLLDLAQRGSQPLRFRPEPKDDEAPRKSPEVTTLGGQEGSAVVLKLRVDGDELGVWFVSPAGSPWLREVWDMAAEQAALIIERRRRATSSD